MGHLQQKLKKSLKRHRQLKNENKSQRVRYHYAVNASEGGVRTFLLID